MSYGLNVEMHKQVEAQFQLNPCIFRAGKSLICQIAQFNCDLPPRWR